VPTILPRTVVAQLESAVFREATNPLLSEMEATAAAARWRPFRPRADPRRGGR